MQQDMLTLGWMDGWWTASPVCGVMGIVSSGSISLGLGFYFSSWINCEILTAQEQNIVPFTSVLTLNK